MKKDKQAIRMTANIFLKTKHYAAARKLFADLGDLEQCTHVDALVIDEKKRAVIVNETKKLIPLITSKEIDLATFRCHIDFIHESTEYLHNLN